MLTWIRLQSERWVSSAISFTSGWRAVTYSCRRTGGPHGRDVILGQQPAQQQLLVGDGRGVEVAAHVGHGGMRARLCHDLLGAWAIENFGAHFLVHRSYGFLAEMTERIADDLVGHLFVALADDHIDRRLAADELRERRDHDRVAELDAHAAGLHQGVGELRLLADLAELMAEVGDHAARHLVLIGGFVVFGRHAERKALALGDGIEMLAHRAQHLLIDHRLVAERAEIVGDVEDRRQRRAVGERRDARVHDPDAELHRLERDQGSEAGGAMAVQLDGDAA